MPVVANAASYFHNVDEESEKKIRNEAFERYEVFRLRDYNFWCTKSLRYVLEKQQTIT